MTVSGIDTALKFRHLFILRHGGPPGGAVTATLVDEFRKAGGKFITPSDEDLRIFVALAAMALRKLPGFDTWLRQRQPLFETQLFQEAGLCPPPFLSRQPREPEKGSPAGTQANGSSPSAATNASGQATAVAPKKQTERRESPPAQQQGPHAERVIPIGRRYAHDALGDPVTLKANLLFSHIAILAGSGSGKTVLLRRIIEEATVLGIPAIVLDPNNDLSRLGDLWPARPETWSEEDATKADAYHARADVAIWTPGVTSGAPISLNLLPDFAAIGDKQDSETTDERAQAVEMARATLEPYIGGTGQKALLKQGILADALRAFAKAGGGSLDDFIRLLDELPEGVSKIGNASKLAGEIADQLLAAIATNPLLKSEGQSLDPKAFLGLRGIEWAILKLDA
jgi:hypothetical protein